jgi:hypothetical protein
MPVYGELCAPPQQLSAATVFPALPQPDSHLVLARRGPSTLIVRLFYLAVRCLYTASVVAYPLLRILSLVAFTRGRHWRPAPPMGAPRVKCRRNDQYTFARSLSAPRAEN